MPLDPQNRTPRPALAAPGRAGARGVLLLLLAGALALVPAAAIAQDRAPRIESVSYDAAAGMLTLEVTGVADPFSAVVAVDGADHTPTVEIVGAASAGTLVIAIEASSSTEFTPYGAGSMLRAQQDAAIQLVKGLRADVPVGLVVFGDEATLVQEPTTDHTAVVEAIDAIQAGAYSTLFDGVALAASTLGEAAAPGALALFTYGWHFGVGGTSASGARAAVAASGAVVHSFALGFDYDITFLGGVADASGGLLHREVSAADLAAVTSGLASGPASAELSMPIDLAPGEHTVELRTASGLATTAVMVESVLVASVATGGGDDSLVVTLTGAPEGAAATVSLADRPLVSGPVGTPLILDSWDLEPGAAVLTIDVVADGAPASTTTLDVTVPTLEPRIAIEPPAANGEIRALARVQRGVEWTFVVLVEGVEVYRGLPDTVVVAPASGASVEARLVDMDGATVAAQRLQVPTAASSAAPGDVSSGLPWGSVAAGAALLALALLVFRRRAQIVGWARKIAGQLRRPRGRWRSPAMLSIRTLHEDDRDDLALHYQPLFDAKAQRVRGAEALLRWDDPDRGVSAARHFLTRAAALEMLPGATEWVMRTACTFARDRQLEGLTDFRITVNVTVGQLTSEGFVEAIENALRLSGLAPRFLAIELTEMSVLGKRAALVPVLERVASLGVGVSIDDFWAPGGSTEAVDLPGVVAVKVDLWSNTGSPAAREQITGAVAVARERDLTTIAKRVETVHEMSFFRTLGCDAVQGNAYGAPMAEPEFVRRLAQIEETTRLAG